MMDKWIDRERDEFVVIVVNIFSLEKMMTDKKKTKKIEQNFSTTTDRKKERIQRIKRLTRVRRRL